MNLLDHRTGRGLLAFAFYFAEGIPIGFIWWAMPTLLRQAGAGTDVIGSFTALLILPWVFKFLWAPLIDIFRSSRFGFIKWIALSQILMCLSLVPLVFIPLAGNITAWAVCLFLHSMFAATQDVSVDALMINVVARKEKGKLNGYMQAGMLLARSLFGGAVLIFAQEMGLQPAVGLMIVSILVIMLLLFFIKEPVHIHIEKLPVQEFRKILFNVFKNRNTWYCIAFALTAAAAFEAAGAFAGPFFTDQHIPQKSIGFFFAVPVVVSMLLGGLAGGFLSDSMNRKRSVNIYLLGFTVMVASFSALDLLGLDFPGNTWMALYSIMYFFTGMFTAASYALFMDVTDTRLGATQFSSFMAATNGCEAWVVYSSGLIAASAGYGPAFLAMCLVSVSSLFFLKKIKSK